MKSPANGRDAVVAKLLSGPELAQADFGNPLAPGGTAALCLYDDAGLLAAALEVDRAGESCGNAPCWKAVGGQPPAGRGYSFKDHAGGSEGVRRLDLEGRSSGSSKLTCSARTDTKGGGRALPKGIAGALSKTKAVTVQIHTSDAACFSITLTEIKKQEPGLFKAR